MATVNFRPPSIRVSFESMLHSGTDTRMMVIQISLKHKRTIFLRDRRLGQIVDSYERNTESGVSFPFPLDSLGLSSDNFRAQVCEKMPGLAPSICSELSQQMFLYAQRVSLARQDLNEGVMVVVAHVEIEEQEVEEVYNESSVDDDNGILSDLDYEILLDLDFDIVSDIDEEGEEEEEESNPGPRGLSLGEINRLKQEKFESSGGAKEESSFCSICLEEFLEGVNITPLPCSHTFHHSCIATWLEKQASCPLCRLHITPPCS